MSELDTYLDAFGSMLLLPQPPSRLKVIQNPDRNVRYYALDVLVLKYPRQSLSTPSAYLFCPASRFNFGSVRIIDCNVDRLCSGFLNIASFQRIDGHSFEVFDLSLMPFIRIDNILVSTVSLISPARTSLNRFVSELQSAKPARALSTPSCPRNLKVILEKSSSAGSSESILMIAWVEIEKAGLLMIVTLLRLSITSSLVRLSGFWAQQLIYCKSLYDCQS